MTNRKLIDRWEDVPWEQFQWSVFRIQKRIYRLSQESARPQMHKLQKLLANSLAARCLAVRLASEESSGKDTAGIDGVRSLTDAQKLKMAKSLNLSQKPKPLLRVSIPKPGSTEKRNLGIPTIADRALQQLIVLVLTPEWEARFTAGTYGYRKGRGAHDALTRIRQRLQNSPQWVLDADIEKFFDRLSHTVLLEKLNTFPGMHTAISRTLKSGVMVGTTLEPTELGTPQGGPLSPLLANIALCGLERDLHKALGQGTFGKEGATARSPCLVVYADDFIVLHKDKATVLKAKEFIEDWIKPLGLKLHPAKTHIVHSLNKDGPRGPAGFDFLGCHIQQFRVAKTAVPAFYNGLYTHISPSKKSVSKLLGNVDDILIKYRPNKHWNAAYKLRQTHGQYGPWSVLVQNLNRVIRGWAEYHRWHNSKDAFSRVDDLLFWKLLEWLFKVFPHAARGELVEYWFKPLGKWCFAARDSGGDKPVELLHLADTKILSPIPLQSHRSYFDGDWVYWAGIRGEYPGLPSQVASLLRSQNRRCGICKCGFDPSEQPWPVIIRMPPKKGEGGSPVLVHHKCVGNLSIAMPGTGVPGNVLQ